MKQIKEAIGKRFTMKLLMRGSEDGFAAEKFHKLCDDKGPTLTVVKSDNSPFAPDKVFGGFTTLSWQSPSLSTDFPDKAAFLFSITHETLHPVEKSYNAVTHKKDNLVTFGSGYDLSLCSNCDKNDWQIGRVLDALPV